MNLCFQKQIQEKTAFIERHKVAFSSCETMASVIPVRDEKGNDGDQEAELAPGGIVWFLNAWQLTSWIWGAVILHRTNEANTQHQECENIWHFGKVVVILTALFQGIVAVWHVKKGINGEPHSTVILSIGLGTLVALTWGLKLYVQMSPACKDFYSDAYPQLWIWFLAAVFSSVALTTLVVLQEIVLWVKSLWK